MRRPALTVLATMVALGATAASAVATPTGYSPWEWSTPTPSGQGLYRLAVVGTSVYAVGQGGVVLRSDDGGATWQGLPSGTENPLEWVAPTYGGGVTLAGTCDVMRSTPTGGFRRLAYTPWCQYPSGYVPQVGMPASIFSLAPDGVNGFVMDRMGTLVTTADGGATFTRRTSAGGPTDFVALTQALAMVAANGQIQRTTDGGNTWATVTAPPPGTFLNALTSNGNSDYYAAGQGVVMRSIDSGATWTTVNPGIPQPFRIMRIACQGDVCLGVTGGPQLYRITGAGTSTQTLTPSSSTISDVAFTSATRAVAVATDGSAVISDDAGVTWRPVGSSLRAYGQDLTVPPVRARGTVATSVSLSQDGVIHTSDAGASWAQVRIPSSARARDGQFVSADIGFVLDTFGVVYRTANAGVSWQVFPGPLGSTTVGIVARTDRQVFLYGRSRIVVSDDGGARFRDVAWPRRGAGRIMSLENVGSTLVLRTGLRVFTSTNAGRTWLPIRLAGVQGRVTSASCSGRFACWVTTARGGVYVTTNGGRRWANVSVAAGAYAGRGRTPVVAAQGARGAYLAWGTGWVARTKDSGLTWVPQRLSTLPVPAVAATPSVAYAVDQSGAVLRALPSATAGTPTRITLRVRKGPRPNRLVLSGRLTGAQGGETLSITSTRGERSSVTVSSNGSFTITRAARPGTGFVAQWAGDGVRQGAATPVTRARR